jgi:hypothetical protein
MQTGFDSQYEHPTLAVWQSVQGMRGHDDSGIREMEYARNYRESKREIG